MTNNGWVMVAVLAGLVIGYLIFECMLAETVPVGNPSPASPGLDNANRQGHGLSSSNNRL